MKSLVIVNPAAGSGRPEEFLSEIEDTFPPGKFTLVVTKHPRDAEAAAQYAAEGGHFASVLVAGGDGTVNEVVNGLVRGGEHRGAPTPLGIIPLGTQNVLAHELSLPIASPRDSAAVFATGKTTSIDVGEANGRYFTLMAGFGFDGAVISEVTRPVKELIGPAAYAFATLGALAKYHCTTVHLELDGESVRTEAYLVVVANAASYAYRQIKLAPFAALDDGWLDVCVFERPQFDKVGFATQIMAALAGRHLRDPRVRYYRARNVQISSSPPINGQLDGDIFEPTPMSIRIVPKALHVLVP